MIAKGTDRIPGAVSEGNPLRPNSRCIPPMIASRIWEVQFGPSRGSPQSPVVKEKSRSGEISNGSREGLKVVIFGLRPTGTACGRKSNSKSGDDWCCLRSTLRGLYAYETNHPPDSHLPYRQGVNPIMQPYYGSALVAVLPQEFEKLWRRSLLPLSTERPWFSCSASFVSCGR